MSIHTEGAADMFRATVLRVALVILAGSIVGCGGSSQQTPQRSGGMRANAVRRQAAFDLNCPEDQIDIVTISSFNAQFGARGCAKRASYIWRSGTVIMNSPIQTEAPAAAPATTESQPQPTASSGSTSP